MKLIMNKIKNFFSIDIQPNRIYGLDILRAYAIISVVIAHGLELLPPYIRPIIVTCLSDGVTFFFVLSGFLIGGILIKELENKGNSFKVLKDFWKRRWLRTLPNYFFVLVLLMLIAYLFNPMHCFHHIPLYFVFGQNLFSQHPEFFPEAWSLSIEEWFYLIIPSLIFFISFHFKKSPRYTILSIIITIILFSIVYRWWRLNSFGVIDNFDIIFWDNHFRKIVTTRMDSLMYGLLGAYFSYYHRFLWKKVKIPLLILGFITNITIQTNYFGLVTYQNAFFMSVFSFVFNSLAPFLFLPFLSELKSGKGIIFKFLTFISIISYSLYLMNLNVYHYVNQYIFEFLPFRNSLYHGLRLIGYATITIFLSFLLYKYIESPFMKMRDKL